MLAETKRLNSKNLSNFLAKFWQRSHNMKVMEKGNKSKFHSYLKQTRLLVIIISFSPSLIFVGKTGAYLNGGSLIWGSILMGVPFLASKFRLDVRYKQSMHSILVFISLLGEIDQQNSILVFVISFCPCLIFVGKTGAYSIGGSLIWGFILTGGSFPCFQIQTRLQVSDSDKHASLIFKETN